ncbi:ABC transporter substrate-binding protein [Vallicoccus soli]|nr:ABC transporter substrate-binding protein [Vallicoccus soli]
MPVRPLTALAALAAAGSLLLTGCGGAGAEGPAPVAADAPLPTDVPPGTRLVVADQSESLQTVLRASGELDDLPFEVEFANFTGGPAILEAFRAGAADVAPVGDTPPIQALVAGEDVPIVLARQVDPRSTRLAVAPGAGVDGLDDLRGKRLAYAPGTAQQAIVLRALEAAGLTTGDVELVELQLADFPDAVRTGQVDVAPLLEPSVTRFLEAVGDEGGSVLPAEDTAALSTGLTFVYARRAVLQDEARAAAVRALVERTVRAYAWVNEHPEEWVQEYYVESQGLSAEDGRRIVASQGEVVFPALDEALVARQQATIDLIDAAGELPRPVRAADGFDLRFGPVVARSARAAGARVVTAGR